MIRPNDLLRDERGTSMIELSFVLPIFAIMLVGVVDISRAYSQKLQMEQAAQRAIERVQRNGYKTADEETIESEAAAGAGVSASNVTLDAWLECSGTKTSFTGSCSAGQSIARYVTVEVKKNYTPFFSTKYLPGGGSGTSVELTTEAGIRIQ